MIDTDTVETIPDSAAPPNTPPFPTPNGQAPSPSGLRLEYEPALPRSLPSTSPEMTPQVTAEAESSASNPRHAQIHPAFAKAEHRHESQVAAAAAELWQPLVNRIYAEIVRVSNRGRPMRHSETAESYETSCLAATTL